eukprot:311095-Prymnesium_polylepis.1
MAFLFLLGGPSAEAGLFLRSGGYVAWCTWGDACECGRPWWGDVCRAVFSMTTWLGRGRVRGYVARGGSEG